MRTRASGALSFAALAGIAPPAAAGYRDFPEDTIRRIRFIKRAQELGFTLEEIQVLLELSTGGGEQCPAVQQVAEERVADIEARIRDLEAMRGALESLIAACRQRRPGVSCPIIEWLEKSGTGLKVRPGRNAT